MLCWLLLIKGRLGEGECSAGWSARFSRAQSDGFGSQREHLEEASRQAWVKSRRRLWLPGRLQSESNLVRLQIGSTHHFGASYFAGQVARESMAANPDDIFGGPFSR